MKRLITLVGIYSVAGQKKTSGIIQTKQRKNILGVLIFKGFLNSRRDQKGGVLNEHVHTISLLISGLQGFLSCLMKPN